MNSMDGFAMIAGTGGLLIAALLIEVILRIAGSFSQEAKEGFRRVYITGCGIFIAIFIWLGGKNIVAIRYIDGIGFLFCVILLVSAVLGVLLNRNKGIN